MPIPGVYQRVAEGQQSQRKAGTVDNPKKFKGQDFNAIRDLCLNRRQLFEDDAFSASPYSIGEHLLPPEKLLSIKWKRPTEIQSDPQFMVDGASIFDIMQGEIGDCWVLSVVGALTLHRKFLENVVPKDQEFGNKYAGIFHFRFWQFGEWVDVVVDDRLPMLNGKYLSVQPRTSNEFWPSLLEKAYAKLRGSYQNLHWGFISEALVDFTGGVQMGFNLSKPPPDLGEIVIAGAKSACLGGCTTPGELRSGNPELQNGLVQGHAYTVTDAKQVDYNNSTEDIVRLWNPWGQGEWNGRWSDRSPQWDRVRPEDRKLNTQCNDGEFWISCTDFLQNFSQLNVCNLTPTYMDFDDPQHVWQSSSYYNQWVRGSTAGGCASAEDMWENPQYTITVTEGARKGYNVTIALMQSLSNERKYNPSWIPIGFNFCRGAKTGSQQKISRQQVVEAVNTGLERAREVTRSFMAPPGTYVVLPFTQNKGQESDFFLRIFTKTSQIAEYKEPRPTSREDSLPLSPNNSHTTYQNSRTTQRDDGPTFYNSNAVLNDFGSRLTLNPQTPKWRWSNGGYDGFQDSRKFNTSHRANGSSRENLLAQDQWRWSNGGYDGFQDSRKFIASHRATGSSRENLLAQDQAVLKKYQDDNYENVFARYVSQGSEMYAEQLQRFLNDDVTAESTFVADRSAFSLDTCRGILMLMDLNANGRLSLQEFGRFWKRLNMCKDIFRSIDVNQTGYIDGYGLSQAIQEVGLVVSDAVLNIMLLRYSNSQKLTFVDFMCCMIRLETVTKVFKNLTKDGRGVYLSGEEWMQIIMSS
ncbi:calpain-13-like [Gastrophryne carolinensis]